MRSSSSSWKNDVFSSTDERGQRGSYEQREGVAHLAVALWEEEAEADQLGVSRMKRRAGAVGAALELGARGAEAAVDLAEGQEVDPEEQA